jgi:hypothetical protein
VIDGDLTVQGTTTTVNTEDLFVEDRLMRLNVGTEPSFSGNTGIEMEVGSDGYVEFHWNDTDSCWEISIDRSVTPEAQTFRALPYLGPSPDHKDLGAEGDDDAHNDNSGADLIGTNVLNFDTFGPDMFDGTVQSALEAIDAYLSDLTEFIESIQDNVTLQVAYDNDPDGGDATIITNPTDGNIVIAGTECLQITSDCGFDLDSQFDADISGGDSFDLDVTGGGGFHLDAYGPGANSNITVDNGDLVVGTTGGGILTLEGDSGVVIDGGGNNVIPATTCTDSLGDATHGWSNIYLCDDEGDVICLIDEGDGGDSHNDESGANLVGTNATNFNTFGPDMFDNTVQSALEAIDAYLDFLSEQITPARS